MSDDPFAATSSSTTAKPLAPRTPSLIELPTCPVCLERMDETTGLLTILCQHVFHCTCLQKWSGGGCPVCRYTHDDFSSRPGFGKTKSKFKTKKSLAIGYEYDIDDEPIECETCHAEANLWQCLICGKVGCGRYDAKHAFSHFEDSGHCFAMDMESKRVWDYAGDGYVHRIIQDGATGEKLVELPGSRRTANAEGTALEDDGGNGFEEEKMEGLALEYTHLLTSQLESQRVYFEEKVGGAADKAAKAAVSAIQAAAAAEKAAKELEELKTKYDDLARDAVPALEKEKARLERRSEKFESMAREMEKDFKEEKAMNGRLMERIEFMSKEIDSLKAAKLDLEEQNRDLTFFISSSEKLKEAGEDIQEGTVSVPDPSTVSGRKKVKGKGKK
jgi:BRCA1-associated protein